MNKKTIKQITIFLNLKKMFPDDTACKLYLQNRGAGPMGVYCPRCGSEKVYALKNEAVSLGIVS